VRVGVIDGVAEGVTGVGLRVFVGVLEGVRVGVIDGV